MAPIAVDPKTNFAIVTGMLGPKIGATTTPNTTRTPTMKHTKSLMQASGTQLAHEQSATLAKPLAHVVPSLEVFRYYFLLLTHFILLLNIIPPTFTMLPNGV